MENPQEVSMEELLGESRQPPNEPTPISVQENQLRAMIEAIIYVAEEPLTAAQIGVAVKQPVERVREILRELIAEFDRPEHGVSIREVAGGFQMATKAEHHDAVRDFVKALKPPLKLSLPALETLAVIAYKQPVTGPEVSEIRGVQGSGVLKTLLERKLIAIAGHKNVIGKPILYKTTKEFMVQFGLKDLAELPSLKEFEEIRRVSMPQDTMVEPLPHEPIPAEPEPDQPIPSEPTPEEPVTAASEAAEVEAAEPVPTEEPAPAPEQATEPVDPAGQES